MAKLPFTFDATNADCWCSYDYNEIEIKAMHGAVWVWKSNRGWDESWGFETYEHARFHAAFLYASGGCLGIKDKVAESLAETGFSDEQLSTEALCYLDKLVA